MKKIGIIALLAFVLVGCGAGTKTTVCELNKSENTYVVTETFESKEDVIKSYKSETAIQAPTKDELDSAMDQFESLATEMSKTEGVTVSYERSGDIDVKQVVTVDLVKADFAEVTGASLYGYVDGEKSLTLTEIVSQLEGYGFTCK